MTQYQDRIQHMQATEIDLRNQITLYTSKYDEFQKALIRSNDVFTGFKTEMEKVFIKYFIRNKSIPKYIIIHHSLKIFNFNIHYDITSIKIQLI